MLEGKAAQIRFFPDTASRQPTLLGVEDKLFFLLAITRKTQFTLQSSRSSVWPARAAKPAIWISKVLLPLLALSGARAWSKWLTYRTTRHKAGTGEFNVQLSQDVCQAAYRAQNCGRCPEIGIQW